MVCSQFQKIGVNAKDMTMADLIPGGNWTEYTDTLKIFADNSTVEIELVYVGEKYIKNAQKKNPDAVIGWYQKGTKTFDPCYNTKKLPYGCTVMAYAAEIGSYITTSGEVVESEDGITFEFPEEGKFQMVGNCTPVDLTMKDFVPGGNWTEYTDTVKIFADNSTVEIELVYVGEKYIKNAQKKNPDAVIGWYQKGTKTFDPCYNTKTVPAGSGFMAYAAEAGSTITIPSAL